MAEQMSLAETEGTALAAYLLSVTTLRALRTKGILDQQGVEMVLGAILSALERMTFASPEVTTAARQLLAGLAAELEVPLKPLN